jgi:hypothetical protein
LPQTQRQRDRPTGAVRQRGCRLDDGPRLFLQQRFHLGIVVNRRVHKGRNVPRNLAPANRHLQRPRQNLVQHEDALARQTFSGQSHVKLIEVFRQQPVNAVLPEAWNYPPLHFGPVDLVDCGLCRRARCDRVQPSPHPDCERRSATRFRDLAGIALYFKILNSFGRGLLGLPHHVASIFRAVFFHAHDDPAMPVAV